ncbi:MAG TPA: hypothetical protein VM598_02580 [Bdellovibrionota bacterium]|nr:hypothetical protein [Bdellovibrionota bacterium]
MRATLAIISILLPALALAAPEDLSLDLASEPVLARGTLAYHAGNPSAALETYMKASQAVLAEKRDRKETAPYVFEIGLIRLKQKRRREARESLQYSLEQGFNPVACHYFLGTLEYEDENLIEAELHFRQVVASRVDELRAVSAYYLGQILSRLDDGTRASRNFLLARNLSFQQATDARALPETKALAGKILSSVLPLIEPLDHGHWFGSFALLSAYDTNVLSVPSTSLSDSSSGPSQASAKGIARFGLGYATSPLDSLQLVPSYEGSVNYNLNQETKSGQFFTHDLEIYVTENALASSSWGLKLEGLGIFQFQTDPESGSGSYSPYSLTALIGPYFRSEIQPKTILTVELYGGLLTNYTDPNVSEVFRRSGPQELLRLSLRRDTRQAAWNPGIGLTLEAAQPEGSEFKAMGATLQLNDRLFPSDRTTLVFGLDLGAALYSSRPGENRHDEIVSLLGNIVHRVPGGWSILGSVQGIRNFSNIEDTYGYTRLVAAAGVGYAF